MTAGNGEPKASEASRREARPAFVGREAEWARLADALEELPRGHGRLLLVTGEPGIGKTRLAEETARHTTERGASAVWGRCWEGEGAPDLWPWLQVIRTCLRTLDDATLRALVGPHASALTSLVAPVHAQHSDAASESPAARFRLFNAIAHFLDGYARRTPLVLILDDLQRADAASLVLLQFLAQEQRERPILLIGTYRDPGGTPNRALAQTLMEVLREPGTERVVLEGFSSSATERLLTSMVDVAPSGTLLSALHHWTGGIPFLLHECARELVQRGDGGVLTLREAAANLPIPPAVRERIEQRLAPVSAAERDTLRVAAASGGDIEDTGIATAKELRIIIPAGAPQRYRFAQGIVASVLDAELSADARARVHSARDATTSVTPSAAPADADRHPARSDCMFRQEGEYWTIAFAGRTCRVKDMKGLAYVAFLLRHASQSVHVSELLHLGIAGNEATVSAGRFEEGMVTRKGLGDAGVVLDARAKAAYRRRLNDLHAELEQARAFNDSGRAKRAQHEIDSITSELTGAVGLGGRDRRVASDAERARVNIARSITRALNKLHEVHPEIARHLGQTIRTGAFCTYTPDASITDPWDC